MAEAYIVAAARTAGGRKGGRLAGWHPADLAASVLDTLVDRGPHAADELPKLLKALGIDGLRRLGHANAVYYDIKSVFPKDAVDARL